MTNPFRKTLIAALFVPTAAGLLFSLPANAMDAVKAGAQVDASAHSSRAFRASTLIGMNVKSPQGENLGEIKDIIVNVNNGNVQYAVLEFGGFLGLGEKLFAYPVSSFKTTAGRDDLVLNVDKAKLKAAPGFARDTWPDWGTHRGEVDRYHGVKFAGKATGQKLHRASELIGKDVNDRSGKDVGEVKDLVIDMGTGKVDFAVLEFDKSWNLNDKLLAVQMRQFAFPGDRGDLVINADKASLDTRKAFDKSRWPELNGPNSLARHVRNPTLLGTAAVTPIGTHTQAGTNAQPVEQSRAETGYKASELIGMNLKTPSGEGIGEIKDLVVQMSTGDVRYAIVSLGGFLGVGDNLYAVPLKSFKKSAGKDRLGDQILLTLDKAGAQRLKSFPKDRFPAFTDNEFWGQADKVAGLTPMRAADMSYAYRASDLMGKDVVSVAGKDIGDIKDLVVDMETHKIRYAVLAFDPGILRSEKYFAFPTSSFQFQRDRMDRAALKPGDLVLNVEKSRLETMQGFDKDKWPDRTAAIPGDPSMGRTSRR